MNLRTLEPWTTEERVDIQSCPNDEFRKIVEMLFDHLQIVAIKGNRKGWSGVLMLRSDE